MTSKNTLTLTVVLNLADGTYEGTEDLMNVIADNIYDAIQRQIENIGITPEDCPPVSSFFVNV